MQLLVALAAATAVLSSSASASCFNTGQNWGNHDTAFSALTDACKYITGHFDVGQLKGTCRNGDGHCYNLEVQNNLGYATDVSQSQCYDNIGSQINNCGHGGQVTVNGIHYRGDPNSGSC